MKECWLPIKGYEGLYEISNFGEIRSLDRITPQLNCFGSISKRIYKGTILSIRKPKGKYPYVLLSKNGKRKTYKIHRLVAQHFIDNPENKPEVNHVDDDKENSNASNLEWVTSSENKQHAVLNGLMVNPRGENAYNYRGNVSVFDKNGTRIDILKGHADILSKGYTSCGVSAVLTGRQKTHRGFYFKLEENND
jgi:hypothetical protein